MAVSVDNSLIRTRPASYTPTVTNGTNGTASGFWYRDGQFAIIDVLITWTAAGDAGALAISLPSGVVIDTAFLTGGTSAAADLSTYLGSGQWRDAGTQFEPLAVLYASTTTVNLAENAQLVFGNQMANTDSLKFSFKVPVVGWA